MEHDLDDPHSRRDQFSFEVVDGGVAALDLGLVGEFTNAADEHILVVGAVEDSDHAGPGHARSDAPKEVVGEFLFSRFLEGGELDTLRIDGSDDVADDSAFAGGVHGLQDEEDGGTGVLVVVGGEEALLQVVELSRQRFEIFLPALLAPVVAGGGFGIDLAEAESLPSAQ